jgi:hypothetical protein
MRVQSSLRPIAFVRRCARNGVCNHSSQRAFSVNDLVLMTFLSNIAVGYSGKGIDS